MHATRKRRKTALEAIRRRRRAEDPTYWRYEGAAPIAARQGAVDRHLEAHADALVPTGTGTWPTRAERQRTLSSQGVMALRKTGAKHKIKGCWSMKKPELIEAILGAQETVGV